MEYKLGELVDSISDTSKIKNEKVVLINTSDVQNGKVLNHIYVDNKNLRGQFKKRFKEGDILFSEIRPKNRRFAYIDFDSTNYIASTKLMVLRNKGKINNKYLFLLLTSKKIIEYLQMIAECRSGTFPQITFEELSNVVVNVPDIESQNKIVNIIDAIDKKIELNNNINNNLYELGDAIYKELILDKYDKTNKLSNLYRFQYGKGNNNPSNGGKYPVYGSNGVIGGYDEFNNEDAPVIGHIGANCGSLIFAYGKHYVTYNGIMCNIINSNYRYFGYETLRFLNIKREIRGSSQPFISYDLLNSFDIPLPQNSIIVNIENKLKAIYTIIKNNLDEINTLMQLRDTLLPKLMNGEIDLEKIEW